MKDKKDDSEKADLLKRIEVREKENNELANANSRYKTENHRLLDFNKEEKLRMDRDDLGPSVDNFYFIKNMRAGVHGFTHNEDGEERKNLFIIPFVGFSEDDRHLLFELMNALAKCYEATTWWEDGEGRSVGLKAVFTDTHLGEWHGPNLPLIVPVPEPVPEDEDQ